MKKQLPLGISEFTTVIEEQRYYVDKTALIEDILSDGAQVILFTRPRRFGKTSNIETGIGRSDIMMKSYDASQYPNFVIEFKQGDDVKQLAQDAVEQIKEKLS